MKKIAVLALALAFGLVGCKKSLYADCVEKGIQYYKDVDMYPKLPNGEIADKKVEGMCSNSREAFN